MKPTMAIAGIPVRAPVELLVIDRLEMPSEN